MHEESLISNLSNDNFIRNQDNCGIVGFLDKNFDFNVLAKTERDYEPEYADERQMLMFWPSNVLSPRGNSWFSDKCWPEQGNNIQECEMNEEMDKFELEPTEKSEQPKKIAVKRVKK